MVHEGADIEQNNGPKSQPPLTRSAMRALIADFSPIWFTWCMNSGIIAILLHQLPYTFEGLRTVIAPIFFLFDLILFIVFSVLLLARFVWFGRQAYLEISNSIADLTLFACWPIGFDTLVSLVVLIVSEAHWGQHAFTIVGYVMWWIAVIWTYVVLFWAFVILIRRHDASDRRLPTTVIIPAVSVSTLAVTGGIVAGDAYGISARLAVPVIIVSFMSVGVGILLGLLLTAYLFHALLTKGWPPSEQVTSVFILIGPMGQSAAALQLLGTAARSGNFAGYHKGTFLTAETAPALDAACILIALLLFGLGFIWMILSMVAMIDYTIQRKLTWTPIWNAIIFPSGTLTTSALEFSIEMDSPTFRVITTGLVILMVVFFFVNLAFTVYKIFKGELLIVREDPRVKVRMESEQKKQ